MEFCLKSSRLGEPDEYVLSLTAIIWLLEKDYVSAHYNLKQALEINEDAETPKKILEAYFK
ncbi:MAG TPA: hypothetical protein VNW06_09545, partial [Cytophagaceae bacterium]|nr:hypothetical protein [Cytophagaceae bacterium]